MKLIKVNDVVNDIHNYKTNKIKLCISNNIIDIYDISIMDDGLLVDYYNPTLQKVTTKYYNNNDYIYYK